jgi:hypothetical protein
MRERKLSAPGFRRTLARTNAGFLEDTVRLARLSRGGSPDFPIEVRSASEIEVKAEGAPCPICEGRQRVLDHTVETVGRARLRAVQTSCWHCGFRGLTYFRVGSALPS